MALSLLCGGLGVASATDVVHVDENATGAVEVYTKTGVDTELGKKADKTAVEEIKNTVGDVDSGLVKKTADNATGIEVNKTNISALKETVGDDTKGLTKKINDNTAAIAMKADVTALGEYAKTADVNAQLANKADTTALDGKANTDLSNLTEAGKTAIKTTMEDELAKKADKTALNQATDRITANETAIAGLTTKTTDQQTAIDDLKKKTTQISYEDGDGTKISGVTIKDGNIVGNGNSAITQLANVETDKIKTDSINGKSLTGTTVATEKEVKDVADAVKTETDERKAADTALEEKIAKNTKDIATLDGKVTTAQGDIQTNANNIQANSKAIADTNKRTGGIARNLEDTQTTIEGSVKVDNKGNVKDVEKLSAKKITTTEDAVIGGNLKVTGETTLSGELKAEKDATFEKNVTVEKDLTVNGKLNVDKISLKNDELKNGKKHDSATAITADGISNLAKVTEHGNTTESQFTHNEKGTFNHAKDGSTTDWKESTSNVTADGVANVAKDSKGNNNTITQTSTDTKNILTDKDGNTSTTRQDGKGIYGYAKDKDGNKSYTKQEGNRIAESVIGKDGTETKSEMTSTDITNTAKDGTITNDAKDIVNNATGDMTNTVGGNLTTTVGGNEIHDVKGTKTETVEGKVTENFKGGQETNVTGDQTTNVSGTQTTNATDINRNASSGMIDKVDNAYGTNTETKVAGKTTTEVSIKGTGETAGYIRGATESRDYLIKGTLKNSESKTAETTSTEITDGNGKISSTIQDVTQISGSVTDGTNTSVSNVKADSIDSSVTGGTSISTINQRKDSITSQVTDGTTITKTEQDTKNITNTAKDGTITNDAKDIVNNASGNMTNTVGGDLTTTVSGNELHEVTGKQTNKIDGDQENTIGGNQTTTVTGDISNKAENITNEANTKLTDKVGDNTRVLDSEGITDTVPGAGGKGSTFKQRIDAIMGNVKTDACESEVTQKGDEITSVVGKGEATISRVTQKKGSLEAVVTDGTSFNHSRDIANASAKTLTGYNKMNQLLDDLNSSTKTITDGTHKTSKVQTALDITNTAADGTITNDAKNIVNNASGDMTNTVGGKLTTTVTGATEENYNGGLTTNVTGEENHTVTGKQNNKVTGKQTNTVEGGQENIISGGQTNTITGGQINNITGDQTTNVTGDISNTAKNITNAATDTLTDKVGENTRVITSRSITDTVGRANRMIEDGKITDNAGDFTVTTDKENGTTFTNAGSTASSFTTVDGTNTGSAQEWTNIKGNEISTGKVEANYVKMDYADVMNDLGVKGTTTTKTLKVTENATVGGTLDVTKKATFHDDVNITKNLSVGGNATIAGDVTARSYKVDGKTYIDANGINANNQKITNVADGSISEGSKDAVNGGQLYGVKRDLEHQVDKVGANAAAMANLRPMEFDPSSKWNIAAAIGNYGSETAAAIGAFYRPNDNVMVNLSTAFGTGENMVGGGVSVRLGKGGNKLSREETNALKAQVADLTARMDALLSVLNPNMSKDFPDVPENHWAYEAVSRLAGNDIVQGYPDGEFHGERTMTRYEMAEIIYNALSRGAEAEKELVEEFKPELQAMAASEKATAEKAEG